MATQAPTAGRTARRTSCGLSAHARIAIAPSEKGTPHSTNHCTSQFSGLVHGQYVGPWRTAEETVSKPPRPMPNHGDELTSPSEAFAIPYLVYSRLSRCC